MRGGGGGPRRRPRGSLSDGRRLRASHRSSLHRFAPPFTARRWERSFAPLNAGRFMERPCGVRKFGGAQWFAYLGFFQLILKFFNFFFSLTAPSFIIVQEKAGTGRPPGARLCGSAVGSAPCPAPQPALRGAAGLACPAAPALGSVHFTYTNVCT